MLPVPGPGLALRTLWRLTQTCSSHCHCVGPCCLLFQVWQLCHNWLARRVTGIHFKLSPRFQGHSLAAGLPIRASGGFSDNPTSSSVLWVHSDLKQQAGPGVSDFKVCKPAVLTVTPSHRGTRSRQCWFEKFLPLIEVCFHVNISHCLSLLHIFTLNPVGIPAMCSVGISAVSQL
jgi:hypothetical protein